MCNSWRHALTPDVDFALVLPGLCEVVTRLHPYPRFGSAGECFRQTNCDFGADARTAVDDFGEGLRVTPRIFAPSATDNPKGSRPELLTVRPGWAEFFKGMASSSFS
jgi:hypothetical protein